MINQNTEIHAHKSGGLFRIAHAAHRRMAFTLILVTLVGVEMNEPTMSCVRWRIGDAIESILSG